jgi:hypothetical protein
MEPKMVACPHEIKTFEKCTPTAIKEAAIQVIGGFFYFWPIPIICINHLRRLDAKIQNRANIQDLQPYQWTAMIGSTDRADKGKKEIGGDEAGFTYAG